MSSPRTWTSPLEALSSPPSTCSNVDLPAPDAPTMARRSPLPTSRSTPRSTSRSKRASLNALRRPRAEMTATPGEGSLIAQRLGRLQPRGAQRRVHGRQQPERQRQHADARDVVELELRRQVADVVDLGVQEVV